MLNYYTYYSRTEHIDCLPHWINNKQLRKLFLYCFRETLREIVQFCVIYIHTVLEYILYL